MAGSHGTCFLISIPALLPALDELPFADLLHLRLLWLTVDQSPVLPSPAIITLSLSLIPSFEFASMSCSTSRTVSEPTEDVSSSSTSLSDVHIDALTECLSTLSLLASIALLTSFWNSSGQESFRASNACRCAAEGTGSEWGGPEKGLLWREFTPAVAWKRMDEVNVGA